MIVNLYERFSQDYLFQVYSRFWSFGVVILQGRVGYALEALNQLLYNKPKKVAILGPGFSAPSKAVAELCTVFGTLQVG